MHKFLSNAGHVALILFGGLGIIIAAVVMLVLFSILNGVIIQTMWGWFVVPLGASAIGLAHAIGLSLTVRFFTWRKASTKKNETREEIVRDLLGGIIVPCSILVMGAIVHSFM
ncbi:MAG: hypothetical protein ACTSYO_05740 [Candidatus Ranarchaeia archaeon]